jgi:DNA-binding transcriptional LysR family regulator
MLPFGISQELTATSGVFAGSAPAKAVFFVAARIARAGMPALDWWIMRPVAHLANLDLNLLVALRELVRERSVTRAAQRLGVTQPAASASLSRLRRHFGDELLVREHGEYVLTPLGEQLAQQVEAVCTAAERLFAASSSFDPPTSDREFTLVMADYTIMVMGEALSHAVQRAAPRARLHIKLVRESLVTEYTDGIRFVDGMVAPPSNGFALPETRSAELFRDRWVCVLDGDNPVLDGGSALRVRDLAGLPWVAPYYRAGAGSVPVMRQLALLDLQPRIAVRVESYLAVPYFVTGTDRVALMQERLATKLAASSNLRVLECPGEAEPIVEALWWHKQHEDDPTHAWLRRLITETARRL